MRNGLFIIILFSCYGRGLVHAAPKQAPHPSHYGGAISDDASEILRMKKVSGADAETLNLIEAQNRTLDSGNRSPSALANSLITGQDRAQQMVIALRNQEMQKALVKVTGKGKAFIQENPELKSPLGILSGVVSFWVGSSIRLVNHDGFQFTTRIEAKSRSGEFSMQSPLLNGKIQFKGNEGVNLNVNRSIASINSTAELNYSARTQSVSTQIRHPLAPHLDFSFGASQVPEMNNQTDGRAKIEYQIHF